MQTNTSVRRSGRAARVLSCLAAAIVFLVLASLQPAGPALAACNATTFVGNQTELNAAIAAANSAASPCTFVIELENDIAVTADLNAFAPADPDIELVINGANYAIAGESIEPLLRFEDANEVYINELTVTNEFGIGIMIENSRVSLSYSTVSDNQNDGIRIKEGSLLVFASTIASNGGDAVSASLEPGPLSIQIINSTLANNSAAGVYFPTSTNEVDATLTHVTVTGNAYGIFDEMDVEENQSINIHNSIFDNIIDECETTDDSRYTWSHTLLREFEDVCGAVHGDGGVFTGVDPMLMPLGDYGGPTWTRPPFELPGGQANPVVDEGDNARAVDAEGDPLAFDQRGDPNPRQIGDHVDLGAVEGVRSVVCPTFPVVVDSDSELFEAIHCYNLLDTSGERTITLDADIDLTLGLPTIDNTTSGISLVINGNDYTIDGQDTLGIVPLSVHEENVVTVNDMTIRGGFSPESGGGIWNLGTLTINNVIITRNQTLENGGGIHTAGTFYMNDSAVEFNQALPPDGDAGGIDNEGEAYITDSAIDNNFTAGTSTVLSGGIMNSHTMYILRSSIYGNQLTGQSSVYGGGIFNHGSLVIRDSEIANNNVIATSVTYGGGIFSANAFGYRPMSLSVINSTISGNNLFGDYAYGGGLYVADSSPFNFDCCLEDPVTVELINVTVAGNSILSSGSGGGVYIDWIQQEDQMLEVFIHNSILADNHINFMTRNDCVIAGDNPIQFESRHSLYVSSGSSACGLPVAFPDLDGNIVGVDPQLGALAYNGGPTRTHAFDAHSPAVDRGDNLHAVDELGNPLTADQRGFSPRAFNGTVDIGAYEYGVYEKDPIAVFMSAAKSGTTGDGVTYDNSDILRWDGEAWELWFDGTAAFLDPANKPKHNVNAFWIPNPDEPGAVVSFGQNGRKVPGLSGKVDGTDLVWWDGAAFTLWFDGSDVGLTKKTQEKIDGLHVLPGEDAPEEFEGACEFYMLISTQGPGNVPAFGGGVIKFGGEDVLGFCATNLGDDTAGFWQLVVDGSAVGMPKNQTDSISLSENGLLLYLTTKKQVNLGNGVVGGHSSVFAYNLNLDEFGGPFFRAADEGLTRKVDGLQVVGSLVD